jgi:hypothetical protein
MGAMERDHRPGLHRQLQRSQRLHPHHTTTGRHPTKPRPGRVAGWICHPPQQPHRIPPPSPDSRTCPLPRTERAHLPRPLLRRHARPPEGRTPSSMAQRHPSMPTTCPDCTASPPASNATYPLSPQAPPNPGTPAPSKATSTGSRFSTPNVQPGRIPPSPQTRSPGVTVRYRTTKPVSEPVLTVTITNWVEHQSVNQCVTLSFAGGFSRLATWARQIYQNASACARRARSVPGVEHHPTAQPAAARKAPPRRVRPSRPRLASRC